MFVEEVGGGGENGLESWTEFMEELTTDPNGSEPSSGPEPKSEAASWTVLMLSYVRRFREMQLVLEAKRNVGKALNYWECTKEKIALFAARSVLLAARVEKLSSEQWRENVMEAMCV